MRNVRRLILTSAATGLTLGVVSTPAAAVPLLFAPFALGHVIGAAARLATLPLALASAAQPLSYAGAPAYAGFAPASAYGAPYYGSSYSPTPYYAPQPAAYYSPTAAYYSSGPGYYARYTGASYPRAVPYRSIPSYGSPGSYYGRGYATSPRAAYGSPAFRYPTYTSGYRPQAYTAYSGYRGPSGPGRSMYYRR